MCKIVFEKLFELLEHMNCMHATMEAPAGLGDDDSNRYLYQKDKIGFLRERISEVSAKRTPCGRYKKRYLRDDPTHHLHQVKEKPCLLLHIFRREEILLIIWLGVVSSIEVWKF